MENKEPKPQTRPTNFQTPEGKKTLEQMEEEYKSTHWVTKQLVDFKGWCKLRQSYPN